eukprot:11115864-Prorocentrum_lima.AAC.1
MRGEQELEDVTRVLQDVMHQTGVDRTPKKPRVEGDDKPGTGFASSSGQVEDDAGAATPRD